MSDLHVLCEPEKYVRRFVYESMMVLDEANSTEKGLVSYMRNNIAMEQRNDRKAKSNEQQNDIQNKKKIQLARLDQQSKQKRHSVK